MKNVRINNSFHVKLLATAITFALGTSSNAIAVSASTSEKLPAQQNAIAASENQPAQQTALSPLVILSQRVGDVAREAIGSGIPNLQISALANYLGPKIVYADVNSIDKDRYVEVVNALRTSINAGNFVVLETSEFDFPSLKNFIMLNFPRADISGFNDVAVMLQLKGDQIHAERVDPADVAMYAGIPYSVIASRLPRAAEIEGLVQSKAADRIGGYKITLDLSIKAYESNPTYKDWTLLYNGTYVDVWHNNLFKGACQVAWRGTVLTSLWDVYADLGSQASYDAISIDNADRAYMKGGKGFVNRLHAYDDTVKEKLTSQKCGSVMVSGHSLGGAVASIHALQLAHDKDWRGPLFAVTAWNSPNVIDTDTQSKRLDKLLANAIVNVNCRYHDWLVNPLPTGLHRIGNPSSSPVKGCTFVRTGTSWSWDPNANHNPDLWYAEF